ncbi:MAG: tol-pal system protein YbgF [Nitrospinota bacterium]|nr:tol-pal system protein YbgF [Nitrospinota bacterium]
MSSIHKMISGPLALAPAVMAFLAGLGGCVSNQASDEALARIKDLSARVDAMTEGQKAQAATMTQLHAALLGQADIAANYSKLQDNVVMLGDRLEELNTRTQMLGQKLAGEADSQGASQAPRSVSLEGELRAVNLRLEKLSERLKAISADLDLALGRRAGQAERPAPMAPSDKGVAPMAPVAMEDMPVAKPEPGELYQRAYGAYLSGRYEEAVAGFDEYLTSFPRTELSDNASFWLGEAYLANGDLEEAAAAFDKMAASYPGSNKAPTALLRGAEIFVKMGRAEEARRKFNAIVSKYPAAHEAQKAKERLDEIGSGPGQ